MMISYKDSGVDKEEGYRTVQLMKKAVEKTHNSQVLSGLGSFGAFFHLQDFRDPVLVSGTDGVGTKLEVAFSVGNYDTVGQDCYAMCANDILCHGARPLFFLDYMACGKLEAEKAARLVTGIARSCESTGCALIGGETAEMPGFYKEGDYDLAGFCVGAVEKDQVVNGSTISEDDIVLGLGSNGLHSNGFSLVRRIFTDYSADFNGRPIHEELLKPTRLYINPVLAVLKKYTLKGIAHITGGGLIENVPRILPDGMTAVINKKAIPELPIYAHLKKQNISEDELWGTFNMGVGMVIVCSSEDATAIQNLFKNLGENCFNLGRIEKGNARIQLVQE